MLGKCAHHQSLGISKHLPKLTAALIVVRHWSGVTHQKVPEDAIAVVVVCGIWWRSPWKLSVSRVNIIATEMSVKNAGLNEKESDNANDRQRGVVLF
jgi:hypothetical protein